MQITKLIFKNFMGYKQLELPKGNEELPEGLVLISGQNSYGKSTILEGVLFAFFGPKIFRARNAASFITYGEAKAELTVYFALDNKKYNIYRKWGRTGGTSPKLFEWVKTTYREIKNFKIENFFEISTEQALNTVFVRQGEVEELANKKGADLREMIIDLFRLNIIDDALSHLDKESKNQKYNKEKLNEIIKQLDTKKKNVIEFRHESWFKKEVYDKLKKNKIIFCIVSSPKFPEDFIKTAGDIYIRFHGKESWYRSNYSKKELSSWAKKIKQSKAKNVWAYFNNDANAYAVKNSLELKRILKA